MPFTLTGPGGSKVEIPNEIIGTGDADLIKRYLKRQGVEAEVMTGAVPRSRLDEMRGAMEQQRRKVEQETGMGQAVQDMGREVGQSVMGPEDPNAGPSTIGALMQLGRMAGIGTSGVARGVAQVADMVRGVTPGADAAPGPMPGQPQVQVPGKNSSSLSLVELADSIDGASFREGAKVVRGGAVGYLANKAALAAPVIGTRPYEFLKGMASAAPKMGPDSLSGALNESDDPLIKALNIGSLVTGGIAQNLPLLAEMAVTRGAGTPGFLGRNLPIFSAEAGDIYSTALDRGEGGVRPYLAALGGGAVNTWLENKFGLGRILDKILPGATPPVLNAVKSVAAQAAKGLVRDVITEAGKGVATDLPQEMMQELVGYGAERIGGAPAESGANILDRVLTAGVQSLGLSGLMGGAAGASQNIQQRRTSQAIQDASVREQDRQALVNRIKSATPVGQTEQIGLTLPDINRALNATPVGQTTSTPAPDASVESRVLSATPVGQTATPQDLQRAGSARVVGAGTSRPIVKVTPETLPSPAQGSLESFSVLQDDLEKGELGKAQNEAGPDAHLAILKTETAGEQARVGLVWNDGTENAGQLVSPDAWAYQVDPAVPGAVAIETFVRPDNSIGWRRGTVKAPAKATVTRGVTVKRPAVKRSAVVVKPEPEVKPTPAPSAAAQPEAPLMTIGTAENQPKAEPAQDIQAQIKMALDPATTRSVVLFPDAATAPASIDGLERQITANHGIAFYNKAKVKKAAVVKAGRAKVYDPTHLGMAQNPTPGPIVAREAVSIVAPDGSHKTDQAVALDDPQHKADAIQAAEQNKAPGDTIVIGPAKAVDERRAESAPTKPKRTSQVKIKPTEPAPAVEPQQEGAASKPATRQGVTQDGQRIETAQEGNAQKGQVLTPVGRTENLGEGASEPASTTSAAPPSPPVPVESGSIKLGPERKKRAAATRTVQPAEPVEDEILRLTRELNERSKATKRSFAKLMASPKFDPNTKSFGGGAELKQDADNLSRAIQDLVAQAVTWTKLQMAKGKVSARKLFEHLSSPDFPGTEYLGRETSQRMGLLVTDALLAEGAAIPFRREDMESQMYRNGVIPIHAGDVLDEARNRELIRAKTEAGLPVGTYDPETKLRYGYTLTQEAVDGWVARELDRLSNPELDEAGNVIREAANEFTMQQIRKDLTGEGPAEVKGIGDFSGMPIAGMARNAEPLPMRDYPQKTTQEGKTKTITFRIAPPPGYGNPRVDGANRRYNWNPTTGTPTELRTHPVQFPEATGAAIPDDLGLDPVSLWRGAMRGGATLKESALNDARAKLEKSAPATEKLRAGWTDKRSVVTAAQSTWERFLQDGKGTPEIAIGQHGSPDLAVERLDSMVQESQLGVTPPRIQYRDLEDTRQDRGVIVVTPDGTTQQGGKTFVVFDPDQLEQDSRDEMDRMVESGLLTRMDDGSVGIEQDSPGLLPSDLAHAYEAAIRSGVRLLDHRNEVLDLEERVRFMTQPEQGPDELAQHSGVFKSFQSAISGAKGATSLGAALETLVKAERDLMEKREKIRLERGIRLTPAQIGLVTKVERSNALSAQGKPFEKLSDEEVAQYRAIQSSRNASLTSRATVEQLNAAIESIRTRIGVVRSRMFQQDPAYGAFWRGYKKRFGSEGADQELDEMAGGLEVASRHDTELQSERRNRKVLTIEEQDKLLNRFTKDDRSLTGDELLWAKHRRITKQNEAGDTAIGVIKSQIRAELRKLNGMVNGFDPEIDTGPWWEPGVVRYMMGRVDRSNLKPGASRAEVDQAVDRIRSLNEQLYGNRLASNPADRTTGLVGQHRKGMDPAMESLKSQLQAAKGKLRWLNDLFPSKTGEDGKTIERGNITREGLAREFEQQGQEILKLRAAEKTLSERFDSTSQSTLKDVQRRLHAALVRRDFLQQAQQVASQYEGQEDWSGKLDFAVKNEIEQLEIGIKQIRNRYEQDMTLMPHQEQVAELERIEELLGIAKDRSVTADDRIRRRNVLNNLPIEDRIVATLFRNHLIDRWNFGADGRTKALARIAAKMRILEKKSATKSVELEQAKNEKTKQKKLDERQEFTDEFNRLRKRYDEIAEEVETALQDVDLSHNLDRKRALREIRKGIGKAFDWLITLPTLPTRITTMEGHGDRRELSSRVSRNELVNDLFLGATEAAAQVGADRRLSGRDTTTVGGYFDRLIRRDSYLQNMLPKVLVKIQQMLFDRAVESAFSTRTNRNRFKRDQDLDETDETTTEAPEIKSPVTIAQDLAGNRGGYKLSSPQDMQVLESQLGTRWRSKDSESILGSGDSRAFVFLQKKPGGPVTPVAIKVRREGGVLVKAPEFIAALNAQNRRDPASTNDMIRPDRIVTDKAWKDARILGFVVLAPEDSRGSLPIRRMSQLKATRQLQYLKERFDMRSDEDSANTEAEINVANGTRAQQDASDMGDDDSSGIAEPRLEMQESDAEVRRNASSLGEALVEMANFVVESGGPANAISRMKAMAGSTPIGNATSTLFEQALESGAIQEGGMIRGIDMVSSLQNQIGNRLSEREGGSVSDPEVFARQFRDALASAWQEIQNNEKPTNPTRGATGKAGESIKIGNRTGPGHVSVKDLAGAIARHLGIQNRSAVQGAIRKIEPRLTSTRTPDPSPDQALLNELADALELNQISEFSGTWTSQAQQDAAAEFNREAGELQWTPTGQGMAPSTTLDGDARDAFLETFKDSSAKSPTIPYTWEVRFHKNGTITLVDHSGAGQLPIGTEPTYRVPDSAYENASRQRSRVGGGIDRGRMEQERLSREASRAAGPTFARDWQDAVSRTGAPEIQEPRPTASRTSPIRVTPRTYEIPASRDLYGNVTEASTKQEPEDIAMIRAQEEAMTSEFERRTAREERARRARGVRIVPENPTTEPTRNLSPELPGSDPTAILSTTKGDAAFREWVRKLRAGEIQDMRFHRREDAMLRTGMDPAALERQLTSLLGPLPDFIHIGFDDSENAEIAAYSQDGQIHLNARLLDDVQDAVAALSEELAHRVFGDSAVKLAVQELAASLPGAIASETGRLYPDQQGAQLEESVVASAIQAVESAPDDLVHRVMRSIQDALYRIPGLARLSRAIGLPMRGAAARSFLRYAFQSLAESQAQKKTGEPGAGTPFNWRDPENRFARRENTTLRSRQDVEHYLKVIGNPTTPERQRNRAAVWTEAATQQFLIPKPWYDRVRDLQSVTRTQLRRAQDLGDQEQVVQLLSDRAAGRGLQFILDLHEIMRDQGTINGELPRLSLEAQSLPETTDQERAIKAEALETLKLASEGVMAWYSRIKTISAKRSNALLQAQKDHARESAKMTDEIRNRPDAIAGDLSGLQQHLKEWLYLAPDGQDTAEEASLRAVVRLMATTGGNTPQAGNDARDLMNVLFLDPQVIQIVNGTGTPHQMLQDLLDPAGPVARLVAANQNLQASPFIQAITSPGPSGRTPLHYFTSLPTQLRILREVRSDQQGARDQLVGQILNLWPGLSNQQGGISVRNLVDRLVGKARSLGSAQHQYRLAFRRIRQAEVRARALARQVEILDGLTHDPQLLGQVSSAANNGHFLYEGLWSELDSFTSSERDPSKPDGGAEGQQHILEGTFVIKMPPGTGPDRTLKRTNDVQEVEQERARMYDTVATIETWLRSEESNQDPLLRMTYQDHLLPRLRRAAGQMFAASGHQTYGTLWSEIFIRMKQKSALASGLGSHFAVIARELGGQSGRLLGDMVIQWDRVTNGLQILAQESSKMIVPAMKAAFEARGLTTKQGGTQAQVDQYLAFIEELGSQLQTNRQSPPEVGHEIYVKLTGDRVKVSRLDMDYLMAHKRWNDEGRKLVEGERSGAAEIYNQEQIQVPDQETAEGQQGRMSRRAVSPGRATMPAMPAFGEENFTHLIREWHRTSPRIQSQGTEVGPIDKKGGAQAHWEMFFQDDPATGRPRNLDMWRLVLAGTIMTDNWQFGINQTSPMANVYGRIRQDVREGMDLESTDQIVELASRYLASERAQDRQTKLDAWRRQHPNASEELFQYRENTRTAQELMAEDMEKVVWGFIDRHMGGQGDSRTTIEVGADQFNLARGIRPAPDTFYRFVAANDQQQQQVQRAIQENSTRRLLPAIQAARQDVERSIQENTLRIMSGRPGLNKKAKVGNQALHDLDDLQRFSQSLQYIEASIRGSLETNPRESGVVTAATSTVQLATAAVLNPFLNPFSIMKDLLTTSGITAPVIAYALGGGIAASIMNTSRGLAMMTRETARLMAGKWGFRHLGKMIPFIAEMAANHARNTANLLQMGLVDNRANSQEKLAYVMDQLSARRREIERSLTGMDRRIALWRLALHQKVQRGIQNTFQLRADLELVNSLTMIDTADRGLKKLKQAFRRAMLAREQAGQYSADPRDRRHRVDPAAIFRGPTTMTRTPAMAWRNWEKLFSGTAGLEEELYGWHEKTKGMPEDQALEQDLQEGARNQIIFTLIGSSTRPTRSSMPLDRYVKGAWGQVAFAKSALQSQASAANTLTSNLLGRSDTPGDFRRHLEMVGTAAAVGMAILFGLLARTEAPEKAKELLTGVGSSNVGLGDVLQDPSMMGRYGKVLAFNSGMVPDTLSYMLGLNQFSYDPMSLQDQMFGISVLQDVAKSVVMASEGRPVDAASFLLKRRIPILNYMALALGPDSEGTDLYRAYKRLAPDGMARQFGGSGFLSVQSQESALARRAANQMVAGDTAGGRATRRELVRVLRDSGSTAEEANSTAVSRIKSQLPSRRALSRQLTPAEERLIQSRFGARTRSLARRERQVIQLL